MESRFDPFDPAVLADPAVGIRELLDRCPVHRFERFDPPFFTLSKYADVEAALRDIATFSSDQGQGPRFTSPIGMLADPPQHTYFRDLLQRAFTPRLIEQLRPRVQALAEELIDRAATKRRFDLHDDFALPIPVVVIAELLGVPAADMTQFKHWSDVQVAAMGAQDPRIYAKETTEFAAYVLAHIRTRRALADAGRPLPDDLIARIVADDTVNPWRGEDHLLSVVNQLLVGGNETTTSLITNVVWRLLQDRDRWNCVAADPNLVEDAIEESLRFDPPVLGLYRNTTRDVMLHGMTIPAGSKVYLNYAAANRDPDVFENPDEFSLRRPRKRHLAFGLGVHFCLGAPLARLEAAIALETLSRRLPKLRLEGDGERIAPYFLWGRRHLPVAC